MGLYENQTYENIMGRILGRINPSFDKREGSIIYDATGPASAEIAQLYIALDYMLTCMFVDTAPRENLILLGRERGILPDEASNAVGIGEFNIDLEIGTRFSIEHFNYTVTSKIDTGKYYLTCETAGSEPNTILGDLIPINYISGLTSAKLTSIEIPGKDEENTEAYRARLTESFTYQAFGGNKVEYKTKILDLDGVGAVKVYPTWNADITPASLIPSEAVGTWLETNKANIPSGVLTWLNTVYKAGAAKQLTTGGAVKAVILDSTYGPASTALINTVQTAIDPSSNAGEGVGLAPIGHIVTIASAKTKEVNINFSTIDYQSGWDWTTVKPYAEKIIDDYLLELKKAWQDSDNLIVRISRIESAMLSCKGITDIGGATINTSAENLTLEPDAIPVRGKLSAGV